MKICPKCGYIDEPYWRATYNRKKHEDYTHFENFKIMFPKESLELQKKKRIVITPYVYRLTKFNNVIRTWIPLEKTSINYEKHLVIANNPNQTKLLEVKQK